MGKAIDFKFGVLIENRAHKPKNAKVCQSMHVLCNVTYFYNFGTSSISLESVKRENSNLVGGLTVAPAKQKCKVDQKGVAYFT